MPRRRSPPSGIWRAPCAGWSRSASRSGSSSCTLATALQPRQHRFGGVHLLAEGRDELGVERQVDVDAGAEADEAEPLAFAQRGTRLDVAKDAARDQARHLHAGDVLAVGHAQPERVALVVERGLVERGVEEAPGEIPAFL